jgi:hypothetical protein
MESALGFWGEVGHHFSSRKNVCWPSDSSERMGLTGPAGVA